MLRETCLKYMDEALASEAGIKLELDGPTAGKLASSIRETCYNLRSSLRLASNGLTKYDTLKFTITFPRDGGVELAIRKARALSDRT